MRCCVRLRRRSQRGGRGIRGRFHRTLVDRSRQYGQEDTLAPYSRLQVPRSYKRRYIIKVTCRVVKRGKLRLGEDAGLWSWTKFDFSLRVVLKSMLDLTVSHNDAQRA